MTPASTPLPSPSDALAAPGAPASAPGGPWEDLAALAAQLAGCAMAWLSVSDPALPGAGIGVSASQAPLLDDFAALAEATVQGALTIADAAADARLAGHPMVRGAPFVRFYASVPVPGAAGQVVGSLAVLDPLPRALGPAETGSLHALARQAGRFLHQAKKFANNARDELRTELGPAYSDLELRDLDPRTIVRKHVIEAMEDAEAESLSHERLALGPLGAGEIPPYDVEAT